MTLNVLEATLVRIRGTVQATLTGTSIAHGGFQCAVGIGLVTANAFAAGQGSCPAPITDEDWDGWIWHQFFNLHSIDSASTDGSPAHQVNMPIDSKAMRKVPDSQFVIFGSFETINEVGTATVVLDAMSRMLFKLS